MRADMRNFDGAINVDATTALLRGVKTRKGSTETGSSGTPCIVFGLCKPRSGRWRFVPMLHGAPYSPPGVAAQRLLALIFLGLCAAVPENPNVRPRCRLLFFEPCSMLVHIS